jgi:cation diffusion facilitator family transporter
MHKEIGTPENQKMEVSRMVWAALIGNALIAVAKFTTAAISGSVALLAEGAHSVADTFNQVFLLISLSLGEKPPDEQHPYGHGKDRFFWAFVTAVMLFFLGAFFSIYEGTQKVLEAVRGEAVSGSHFWSYIALGVAVIFESYSFSVGLSETRKGMHKEGKTFGQFLRTSKDPTLKTVLFEDSAALLGLVFALIGIYLVDATGSHWWDGLASIMIGLVLAAVAFMLAAQSRGLLLGAAADREDRKKIRKALTSSDKVSKIIDVLTMHLSPDEILVTAHVELEGVKSVKEIEETIDGLEQEIQKEVPEAKLIFIEPQSGDKRDG